MQACFFAQYLITKAIVTPNQLEGALALRATRNKSLGALAVAANLLTEEQVELLNAEQQVTDLYLGEMAVDKGWLKASDVEQLMIEQWASHSSLGDILVEQELLKSTQLDSLLADFEYYQRRLREANNNALKKLPSTEFITTFLNELVKCSQRICHQKVAVGEVSEHSVPPEEFSHVGLLALENKPLDYIGIALNDDQALRVYKNMGGTVSISQVEEEAQTSTCKFVRLAAESACSKMNKGEQKFSILGICDLAEGDSLPECSNVICVDMVTEQSGFKALFLAR